MGYIDIFPTLLAQTDIENHEAETSSSNFDGINLGPRFDDTKKPIAERNWYTFLGQDHPTNEWMAIKSGDWKLIVHGPRLDTNALGRKHQVALYNIAKYPTEKDDLTPLHPGRISFLAKKLATHRSFQPEHSIGPYMSGSKRPFTPPKHWKISPADG
jgi:arylsulfatase B